MVNDQILKDAARLHQNLYKYGNLKAQEKLLTVSGLLLVLQYGFSISLMNGKDDGCLLYDELKNILDRIRFDEENGRNIVLEQFGFLKTTKILNEIHPDLDMTPLRYFGEFLQKSIPFVDSEDDYIGRFYSEFMSYESSEGQTLGIILTPSHITNLFVDLLKVTKDDVILDPCAGTAGFLISGDRKGAKGLYGYEIQHFMYTISTLNLMIRGYKNIHIRNRDFLQQDANKIQHEIHPTVGMINPPYSLGSSAMPQLYEISFVSHLLDSMLPGGRVAAIIPTSSMTGKTKEIKRVKKDILKKHTLEGVITMNPDSFYGVNTQTVIAIFTAWIPNQKESKFIDFREDGYKVLPHIGLLAGEDADEKRKSLLNAWETGLGCIKKQVTYEDEWLYASFCKREEIPSKECFEKKAEDYLIFRFASMIKGYKWLFEGQDSFLDLDLYDIPDLEEQEWKSFKLDDIFEIKGSKVTKNLGYEGTTPLVCSSGNNNGIGGLYQNYPTEAGNVLTIESSSKGNVHYQQVPFITSGHIEKLILKGREMNVFIGLFLAAALSFEIEGKYSYGYKFNKKRMKQQFIYLPVTNVGELDYDYMEVYIKNILCQKVKNFRECEYSNQYVNAPD